MSDFDPELTKKELEDARIQAIVFHTEALRAGFFNSAIDMMKTLKDNQVDDANAILLDASIEFAVQLWDDTMVKSGITPQRSRKALEKKIALALAKARQRREMEIGEETQQ